MDQKLKEQIMGRVYAGYYVRRYGYTALNSGMFLVASVALWFSVSWKNVIANMPSLSDLDASYSFFSYAFIHTELGVKVSLTLVAIALLGYAITLVRREQPQVLGQRA